MRSVPTAFEEEADRPGLGEREPDPCDEERRDPGGHAVGDPDPGDADHRQNDARRDDDAWTKLPREDRAAAQHERQADEQRSDLGLAEEAVEMERQNALDDPQSEDGEEHGAAGEPEAAHAQSCAIGEEHLPLGRRGSRRASRTHASTRTRYAANGARTPPSAPSAGPITLPTE